MLIPRRAPLALCLACTALAPAHAQIVEITAPTIRTIESASSSQLIVYHLKGSAAVLIFDFPTLEQQGQMFNRVVALIEREGASRSKVLNDHELEAVITAAGKRVATYAFGNDFRSSELARFYGLAERGGIELNSQEVFLRGFLLDRGYIRHFPGGYAYMPPDRVILSVPQEQTRSGPDHIAISHSIRNAILRHEVGHGEFYSNDAYADYCVRFWNKVMTDAQRQAFRTFLGSMSYDTHNEELMINETQAYLIHTPDRQIFDADKVRLTQAEVDGLRNRFWAGSPPSRLFAAEADGGRYAGAAATPDRKYLKP